MKKLFLFMSWVMLILSSCADEDIIERNSPSFPQSLKSATLLKSQSVAAQTAKNAIFLVWTDFLPCVG